MKEKTKELIIEFLLTGLGVCLIPTAIDFAQIVVNKIFIYI